MTTHRITRIAAVALAVAATAAPAASADDHWRYPHLGNGDNRVSEDQPQDLRHADTRDFAEGRGTYNSPEVVVVDAPSPVAEPTSAAGVDWADVGIGAGGLLGVSLIGLGGALFIVHRRGARELAG
jgi:hypothetical protein